MEGAPCYGREVKLDGCKGSFQSKIFYTSKIKKQTSKKTLKYTNKTNKKKITKQQKNPKQNPMKKINKITETQQLYVIQQDFFFFNNKEQELL